MLLITFFFFPLFPPLKVAGDITYNGYGLEEFVHQKTFAYISQYDLHTPEMTVREILDFSARFQGIGNRAGKSSLTNITGDFHVNVVVLSGSQLVLFHFFFPFSSFCE